MLKIKLFLNVSYTNRYQHVMLIALGINVIKILITWLLISKLSIFKDNFGTNHKIMFVTMNTHQITTCVYFMVIYIISFLNIIPTKFIYKSIEIVIVSISIKIAYEYILTINPGRSITEHIIKNDLGFYYKISTLGTIIILYCFASEIECLNEMLNVFVMTFSSLYDINMIFNEEYLVLGRRNGNETLLNKLCDKLSEYMMKFYIISAIFDTCSAIYYKFFTKHFNFFFLYKVFVFVSISIKIWRVAISYDPTIPEFESSSVKHLKKWTRRETQ